MLAREFAANEEHRRRGKRDRTHHPQMLLQLLIQPVLVDLSSESSDDGSSVPRGHLRELGEDEFVDQDGLKRKRTERKTMVGELRSSSSSLLSSISPPLRSLLRSSWLGEIKGLGTNHQTSLRIMQIIVVLLLHLRCELGGDEGVGSVRSKEVGDDVPCLCDDETVVDDDGGLKRAKHGQS